MPAARPASHRPGADPGRRRVLAALLGAPVVGLAGCTAEEAAPTDDGPVELSVFWWGGTARAERTEKALRLYSERNPRVTFRVTWQGSGGYYDRLATQAAGGNVPDLFQLDDGVLTEYAERQIVLDLGRYVADRRLDLSALPPGLARYAEVAGQPVAVAAGQTAAALVVNRDLLRRLRVAEPSTGMSWDQYVAWAQQVSRAGGGRVAGTMDASGDYRALWLWLRGRGGEFYRSRQLGFAADALAEWFALWERARAGRATPSSTLVEQADGGEPARQLVVTGATAASFAWSHQLPELQRLARDELALAALPGPPAAQWARASMYWAAFRGTRHPAVAVDVLNFLTTNGEAGAVLGHDRGLSASLAVRRYTEGLLADPVEQRAAAFGATLADGLGPAPNPPPAGHTRVRALLLDAAESVRAGRADAQAAATRFLAQANAVLA